MSYVEKWSQLFHRQLGFTIIDIHVYCVELKNASVMKVTIGSDNGLSPVWCEDMI